MSRKIDVLDELALHDIDTQYCSNLGGAIAAIFAAATLALAPAAQAQTQLGTVTSWGSTSGGHSGSGGGSWGGANSPTYGPDEVPPWVAPFNCTGHQRSRPPQCGSRPGVPADAHFPGYSAVDPFSALGQAFRYLGLPITSSRAYSQAWHGLSRHTQGIVNGFHNDWVLHATLLLDLSYACILQAHDDPTFSSTVWPGGYGSPVPVVVVSPQVSACYDAVNAMRLELGFNQPSRWDEFWNEVSGVLSDILGRPVEVSVGGSVGVPGTGVSLNLESRTAGGSLDAKVNAARQTLACLRWYETADANACPVQ
jgi:hypothetical protein